MSTIPFDRSRVSKHYLVEASTITSRKSGLSSAIMLCACTASFKSRSWSQALFELESHFFEVDRAETLHDGDDVEVHDPSHPRHKHRGTAKVVGQCSVFVQFSNSGDPLLFPIGSLKKVL